MSSYASTSIPKPKNWQDFEGKACALFRCILEDPDTTTHGRGGQAQQGVDIYGRRGGQGDRWVGVQCKLKGDAEEITRRELEAEIEKAKEFRPALSELIVITTAPDDARIQRVAREITRQHEEEGLFTVNVWGWQTLEREITNYPEAMEAFHPDLTPFSRWLISLSEESVALNKESRQDQKYMIDLLEQLASSGLRAEPGAGETTADRSSAADEAIEQNIHREIDGYRDLLRGGRPRTAKELLDALKARVWESASARVRFRIITNIGAACLELGEQELAAEAFLEAINYDPKDRIGMANAALAHILREEPEQAIAAAEAALQQDPGNAAGAGYLISGHLRDPGVSDPFSLVPDGLRESAAVLASAINFLCHRQDTCWRALARQAAEKHPDEKLLRRRAAEAVLDEAVSSERFEIGGTLAAGITLEDLRDATSVLQDLWDESRASEALTGDTALPQNLARALWALNEPGAASAVLDRGLERTPDDRDLRELRAALYFDANEPEAALAIVGDDPQRPGLALMQARTLLKSDPPRAREILHGRAFSDAPDHQRLAAELLAVETFVQEGQREQALEHAERLVRDYEWSVEPLIELARIQRLLGKEEADQTLTQAVEKLDPDTRFVERFQLANALDDVRRYDDVVSVLEGHVDLSRDSPALRLLLYAYINADRRTTAYELLRGLPAELSGRPPYLRALVAVNANRKDLPAAVDALDRYLALKPDDLEMQLRWASFCLRLNRQDRVEAFLKSNIEELSALHN
jgi:tetratricopeptide (TPR) repeat protein